MGNAKSPSPEPAPPFLVISELYMRVNTLDDLPPGRGVVWKPGTREFKPFFAQNVKPESLKAAIAEGRVYALWGAREQGLQAIDSEWPAACLAAPPHWPARMQPAATIPAHQPDNEPA